jgi:hypothetical protein
MLCFCDNSLQNAKHFQWPLYHLFKSMTVLYGNMSETVFTANPCTIDDLKEAIQKYVCSISEEIAHHTLEFQSSDSTCHFTEECILNILIKCKFFMCT